jgi:hypothetical protein
MARGNFCVDGAVSAIRKIGASDLNGRVGKSEFFETCRSKFDIKFH